MARVYNNPSFRPEVQKKLSVKAKERGFGYFWKGKKRSKETKSRHSESKMGSKNPMWKGGRTINPHGYVFLQVRGKRLMEHRVVMEETLHRPLEKWERVHHINGIKTDNRPENLQLVTFKHHWGKIVCPFCAKEFLIK